MKVPYCEWGICSAREICCGENECCTEGEFDTLVLIAIVLGSLLVLALCCGCLYYKSWQVRTHLMMLKKYMGINYTRMGEDSTSGVNVTSAGTPNSTECIVPPNSNELYNPS